MTTDPPGSLALAKLGIRHQIFRHAGAVDSLEEGARERGQRPSQVVRSILFRLDGGRFVMVLAAGPMQISRRRLRRQLGRTRLALARPDEVLRITGYGIGAVSPFGLAQTIPVLIHQSIAEEAMVSIGSGEPGVALILTSRDLIAALPSAQVVNLRE